MAPQGVAITSHHKVAVGTRRGSMTASSSGRSGLARLARAGKWLTALALFTALLALGGVADATGKDTGEDNLASKASAGRKSDVVVDWSRIVFKR